MALHSGTTLCDAACTFRSLQGERNQRNDSKNPRVTTTQKKTFHSVFQCVNNRKKANAIEFVWMPQISFGVVASPWFVYTVHSVCALVNASATEGILSGHTGYGLLMIMCLQQKMLTLIYFIMSNNLLETLGCKNNAEKQTLNSSNSQIATEKYISFALFGGQSFIFFPLGFLLKHLPLSSHPHQKCSFALVCVANCEESRERKRKTDRERERWERSEERKKSTEKLIK